MLKCSEMRVGFCTLKITFNQKRVFVNDWPILAESLKWCIAVQPQPKIFCELSHSSCGVFCFYLIVAQHESLWWRQFLVSSEVILQYYMLGALFQEPFLHFSHNGIFLLTLAAVMQSTGRDSEEQGRNIHVLVFMKGSRKNTLVSSTSPNLAPIKENIKWTFILGHSEMCSVEKAERVLGTSRGLVSPRICYEQKDMWLRGAVPFPSS